MSSTATARVISADPTIDVRRRLFLAVERTGERERLTIPTDEPFIPMGCNLDGQHARHERTGPIVLEKITTTGRLYANRYEIVRIPVKRATSGWDLLRMFENMMLPNVCIMGGIYRFSTFLPREWDSEEGETFFMGTVYGANRLAAVHMPPTYHAISLSKKDGVLHWNTRCLDLDFSGCSIAIVSPVFELRKAA